MAGLNFGDWRKIWLTISSTMSWMISWMTSWMTSWTFQRSSNFKDDELEFWCLERKKMADNGGRNDGADCRFDGSDHGFDGGSSRFGSGGKETMVVKEMAAEEMVEEEVKLDRRKSVFVQEAKTAGGIHSTTSYFKFETRCLISGEKMKTFRHKTGST